MTTATIQPNLWGQPQRLGSWKEMVREYLEEHPGATPRQVVAYVWQETPAVEEMVTAMRAAPNAAATLAFLLSVAVGLWRLADPPRSAPPNVTPAILNPSIGAAPAEPVAPASAGARPQEDVALQAGILRGMAWPSERQAGDGVVTDYRIGGFEMAQLDAALKAWYAAQAAQDRARRETQRQAQAAQMRWIA